MPSPDEDAFDLKRFLDAQAAIYPQVVEELSAGRKRSHWMWFVFPQIAGLGLSPMATRYAIRSKAEAAAYVAHEILGQRLLECTRLMMASRGKAIFDILGSPDDIKFRSSMTLFDEVANQALFGQAIRTFYPDGSDPTTLEILRSLDH